MIEKFGSSQKSEYTPDTDRLSFIASHEGEIVPILGNEEEQDRLKNIIQSRNLSPEDRLFVEGVIERFETKLFVLDRPDALPDAKRILVTSDNPGSFRSIKPIVKALMDDEKGMWCRGSGIRHRRKRIYERISRFYAKVRK